MSQPEPTGGAKVEHERLLKELKRATAAGGDTAGAARAVLDVLVPHMVLEEEFAIPPLRLLPRLARGEFSEDMQLILPKTERMKSELPRMLRDHELIIEALRRLLQAAVKEQHDGYAGFAQKLIHHAQQEEEVFYPASILVGEYIKARLGLD